MAFMTIQAGEWLQVNPLEGDMASWEREGEAIYREFCEVTSGEGYRDDVLLDEVRRQLDQAFAPVIVECCYFHTTFDWVETAFLFPELKCVVDGRTWYGGYQHTFHINRRNDIEVHPSSLFRSSDGLRMWVDWNEPDVVTRRVGRDRILQTGTLPAAKAGPFVTGHLARLEWSAGQKLKDAEAALRDCSISRSARRGILEKMGKTDAPSRYDLALAAAQYAADLPYERAWKYWQTAGRVMVSF